MEVETPDTEARKPGRPRNPYLETRRRAEILNAAAIVFAKDGYAGADVQVVADHMGVGKGTIYRYFPTKKDLFLAAVAAGLEELSDIIDSVLGDKSVDPMLRFSAVIGAYLSFFAGRPEMVVLFIQGRATFGGDHQPLYFVKQAGEGEDCVKDEFIKELQESGRLRDIPLDRIVTIVGDLLYGTIMTNYLANRPANPEVQALAIIDVMTNGILNHDAPGLFESVKPSVETSGKTRRRKSK